MYTLHIDHAHAGKCLSAVTGLLESMHIALIAILMYSLYIYKEYDMRMQQQSVSNERYSTELL